MDEEKKRIRPKIVVEEGEKLPSVDSMVESEATPNEANIPVKEEILETSEAAVAEASEKPIEEPSTIFTEETKDAPTKDIGIVIPPQPLEKKKGTLTFVLLAIVIALIVALLAGGVYVYMNGMESDLSGGEETTLLSTPSPTDNDVSVTPSPTPAEKVDVSKLKVSILNGSGKIGEAGKVKTAIEKEGYKVTSTGNAATFDFEETVIQAKEGTAQAVLDQLEEILSASYKIEIGDNLKTTSAYDIVITVGSK